MFQAATAAQLTSVKKSPNHVITMKSKGTVRHLLWGVILYSLFKLLAAMGPTLMRFSSPLPPSQTYALLFVGELFSFLPFVGVSSREWSVNKRHEWIAFTVMGCALAANFAAYIYCARNMPLGE